MNPETQHSGRTATMEINDGQPSKVPARFSAELDSLLAPYRAEYRRIVQSWLEDGTFATTYPAFLVETYHYIKHSCPLMKSASALFDGENAPLREYLDHHIVEEMGHEQWVLNDLECLGIDRGQVQASPPLHETMNLIGNQLYVIHCLHPAGLFGYMYMLESQPPTTESLTFLHEAFGIPEKSMSCLAGHADADPHHRDELTDILDRYFLTTRLKEAATVSAISGLSNLNRMIERIRSGDWTTCLPRI